MAGESNFHQCSLAGTYPTETLPMQGDLNHCPFNRFPYLEPMMILDHSPVHSDPNVLGGTLAFRNTRVMAQTLLDYLVAGDSLELFLEHFPTVKREDAVEFLKLACEDDPAR